MFYRESIAHPKCSFELKHKYSDIFVSFTGSGIDRNLLHDKLMTKLISAYDELESYIDKHDSFQTTLEPWPGYTDSDLIGDMIRHSTDAGVGPMASVAGAFADSLLVEAASYADAITVENGGDIAMVNTENTQVMAYPGAAGFRDSITLTLPPGRWGIASSSGVLGHSLSFGKADLVTVVAGCAAQADSFATAIANMIVPEIDPRFLLEKYANFDAILIVRDGELWYRGEFGLAFA